MRSIRISEEVWQEIAKRGTFGETEDDVLKKVFGIEPEGASQNEGSGNRPSKRGHFATNKMHAKVYRGTSCDHLKVRFHDSGTEENWDLPEDHADKPGIRTVMNSALEFGEANGASKGQLFAIRKALTDAGHHLTK